MVTRPTPTDIAARLSIQVGPDFAAMYDAAVEMQCQACVVDPYSGALAEALYRRVANLWASRAHTLGVLDTGFDLGVQYVPQYDPVVDGLERHRRRIAVA